MPETLWRYLNISFYCQTTAGGNVNDSLSFSLLVYLYVFKAFNSDRITTFVSFHTWLLTCISCIACSCLLQLAFKRCDNKMPKTQNILVMTLYVFCRGNVHRVVITRSSWSSYEQCRASFPSLSATHRSQVLLSLNISHVLTDIWIGIQCC